MRVFKYTSWKCFENIKCLLYERGGPFTSSESYTTTEVTNRRIRIHQDYREKYSVIGNNNTKIKIRAVIKCKMLKKR